jgi:excisionase family DNA binding protein
VDSHRGALSSGEAGKMLPLIKPSDLARELGVSRAWIYEGAKAGRIPSVRIGGHTGPLRFVPEDIEEWLAEARRAWRPGRPSVPTRRRGGKSDLGERAADRGARGHVWEQSRLL